MRFENALAKKFICGKDGRLRPVAVLSIIGIALGVMVILLSLFIVNGFKYEVEQKINGFLGTIRISNPDNNYNQYTIPLRVDTSAVKDIRDVATKLYPEAQISSFIDQMAVAKSDSNFTALMMHGVESQSDFSFFRPYLIIGRMPDLAQDEELLLPKKVAQKLGIGLEDSFLAYYLLDGRVKVRKYLVVGIIDTGFDAYDNRIAVTSVAHLQGVNNWRADEVGGLTVTINNRKEASRLYEALFDVLARRNAEYSERYAMFTVEELNYNYFGWLDLLDANVLLIFILMVCVAIMTIVTGVVVLILEKVQAIATLMSLGQRGSSIRKVFFLMASKILGWGLLWGNTLALIVAWVQNRWHLITLDPSQYYMSYVPVSINLGTLLLTNLGVFVVVFLFTILPTSLITTISPAKSLRFD